MCTTTGHAARWGFALLTLALLTGCQKIAWYRHNGKGDTDDKTCRIMQITSSYGESAEYLTHFTFSYNRLGDPVSVINDAVNTGNPNLFFKYDKYNRLIQFIRPYENGSYETWDRYGYNNRGQIVRDTIFGFGEMSATGPLKNDFYAHSDIFYDGQDRICKWRDSVFRWGRFLYVDSVGYAYNDSGNFIWPGLQYDNKLNIHRTNKIWMFICRDYSVNNPFVATAYNEHGLPLVFNSGFIEPFGILAPVAGNIVVDYFCSGDSKLMLQD